MWRYNFKLQLIITLLYFFSIFLMFFLVFLSNILLALLLKALASIKLNSSFFQTFFSSTLKTKATVTGCPIDIDPFYKFLELNGQRCHSISRPKLWGSDPDPSSFFLCFKYHPLCFTCQITSLFLFLRFFISTFFLYVLSFIFYFKFWFRQ